MIIPLVHKNLKASDEDLAKEAASHLANHPEKQVLVEHFENLRGLELSWWKPNMLRKAMPAAMRMEWLKARPDIRARITIAATGLKPNSARGKDPAKQADLIDEAIALNDWDDVQFEHAFEVKELIIYGDAPMFWNLFMDKMPFEEDTPKHRKALCTLIGACMNEKRPKDGSKMHEPSLTHLDFCESIDGKDWYQHLPEEHLIEIDRARYKSERESPAKIFSARRVMEIVTLDVVEANFPPEVLIPALKVAAKNLGLTAEAKPDPLDAVMASPSGGTDSPKADEAPAPTNVGTAGAAPAAPEAEANNSPTVRPAAQAEPDGPNSPSVAPVTKPASAEAEAAKAAEADDSATIEVSEEEVSGDVAIDSVPEGRPEGSSPDILNDLGKEVELIDKLKKELREDFGLVLKDFKADERVLYRVKKIVKDGTWPIGSENDMRQAMILVLKGFDQKLSADVEKQSLALLKTAVIMELGKQPKTNKASAKLASSMGQQKSHATPPPLPATKK